MPKDSIYRVVDIVGHIALAIFLPGRFFCQFLPDVMFPFLLVYSLLRVSSLDYACAETSAPEFVIKDNFLLKIHGFCHTVYFPVLVGSIFGVGCLIQMLSHVLLDQFTHREIWQKRSLWNLKQLYYSVED